MTKNKAKNEGMGTLLSYLDDEIEKFNQRTNIYPKIIFMSKETKTKLFAELNLINEMNDNWYDRKDNYRGILIEIKQDVFIELKGEE